MGAAGLSNCPEQAAAAIPADQAGCNARGTAEEIAYLQGAGEINNVKLRGASVDLSYLQQDSAAYKYNNAKAQWQLLNHNNNGYLYGDGFNAVGTLHISGSLNKDLAVGVTPRFSWDKDEHGQPC